MNSFLLNLDRQEGPSRSNAGRTRTICREKDLSLPLLIGSAVFVFGACLGSFLNVCILRIPIGQSIVRPPSRCAACGLRIPGFLNLPIFGYFILRGRSRCCGAHLDPRYPAIEAGTAILPTPLWFLYPPQLLQSIFFSSQA